MVPSPSPPAWHGLSGEAVAARLRCSAVRGLAAAEATARLARHGANRLAERAPRPAWRKFLDQFRSVLILILLGAAVLAGIMGDAKDAVVIAVVVLLNATLGFVQEHRAERALFALKRMLAPTARVRRDGEVRMIDAGGLVPGDILLLEAGDRIPADARVLDAHAAEVAEAALTGESQAVAKTPEVVAENSALAERRGMVYMNTVVTRGRLEAIVVATGMQTEMGRLAGLLAETAESATPLQLQLDALGKRLALIAGIVVGLMFIGGLLRGDDLVRTATTAIALAVAAIPEGLPAVVTVTLALGMHRMARHHAVVKKLAAVETLGCTTVICSDKTGTLTLNRMAARALFYGGRSHAVGSGGMAGPDLAPLLIPAALCADARIRDGELIGDPTEGALLALAAKSGLDADALVAKTPRIAEIPFDSTLKFMATFHHDGDTVQLWFKGAPDVTLARSSRWRDATSESPLDAAARAAFVTEHEALASQALRVLALAGRRIPARDFDPAATPADLLRWADELTLIGLVGIIDPPRPEAREAIAVCRAAGVRVKMVTGDHRITATAIAHELGLIGNDDGEVHDGGELDGLDQAALADLVERSAVLARVAPEHKLRIVEALQARGHVVAMTGDGVNDAPALKAADIGVAMGLTGTEVAKEAATLVLTDDNFATIVRAVREGRIIYDNIVKFVRFQLSTNIGALLTVIGAPFLGFATPFTAIQILWVNIIMDGPPAMTLGVEPARPGIMRDPPRPLDAAILSWQRLWRIALYGLTMAIGTLAAYASGLVGGGEAKAVTLAFTTFVLFQFFNIFNARAEHGSAFNRQFFRNGRLWAALAAVVLLQGVAVHWPPAQAIFDTVDLTPAEWALAALIASSTLLLEEARKLALHLGMRWRRARAKGP
ncbi:cation-translocating P-type ATPase [Sulfurisoma sediminicola]|uniref:Ca2+-transporting ATPase n=1 Tax=Sulfurisoma sediminicola TaxID=1381557 RepID=A0A497XC08_9PROT|nr:cation-translocating P-type ATPase [Sulfurisoma sediminicola]RLJ63532.1 Ca2+-transporting ATPase [Sulfurisoma sediminicola]